MKRKLTRSEKATLARKRSTDYWGRTMKNFIVNPEKARAK